MEAARDGLKALTRDHVQIARLYDAYQRAPAGDLQTRYRMAHLLCFRLAAHSLLETQLLFPMLREAGVETEFIDEAIIEQVLLEEIVSAIVRAGPTGRNLDGRVHMLGQLAREHAWTQEREVFPYAQIVRVDADKLGEQLEQLTERANTHVLRQLAAVRAHQRDDSRNGSETENAARRPGHG
jgi:hypothetical protein